MPHPLQVSAFALHFVDADPEEQQGLYSLMAGCLRALGNEVLLSLGRRQPIICFP